LNYTHTYIYTYTNDHTLTPLNYTHTYIYTLSDDTIHSVDNSDGLVTISGDLSNVDYFNVSC